MNSYDAFRNVRAAPIVVHGHNVVRATGYKPVRARAGLTARDAARLGLRRSNPADRDRVQPPPALRADASALRETP